MTLSRCFLLQSYLFRRSICELPVSTLGKVFLTLNSEVQRLGGGASYSDRVTYVLLHKQESSRFPGDTEFSTAISERQIYKMRSNIRTYMFERFENWGTLETRDIYAMMDNTTCFIEHIMPQNLSTDWYHSLQSDGSPSEIHAVWLHRLANLTLVQYHPSLWNRSFKEKRDFSGCGYKNSGFRMNIWIAQQNRWGLQQLEERSRMLSHMALKIWPYPETDFSPPAAEFDTCTLADEDISLMGRRLMRFSYQDSETSASSWADMLEQVVRFLHRRDPSVLTGLAQGSMEDSFLHSYVSKTAASLRAPIKVDSGIYLEKHTSTDVKLSILRGLFKLYGEDPSDLVFFLKRLNGNSVP